MTPAKLDIDIRAGLAFGPVTVTCKDADGAVVPLTDWKAYAEVRRRAGAAVIVDLAPKITDGPGGRLTIALSDEETACLTPGAYQWDLILEDPEGMRTGPYIAGIATVQGVITQP